MSDIEKILLGALGAVAVYVVGQVVSKFFIEPLYDLRKAVGEVRFNLAFHAPAIHTPISRTAERANVAYEALMRSSSELVARLYAVPAYEVTRLLALGVLPSKTSIERAAELLRGLSTYVHEAGESSNDSIEVIRKHVAAIERLLRLPPP